MLQQSAPRSAHRSDGSILGRVLLLGVILNAIGNR